MKSWLRLLVCGALVSGAMAAAPAALAFSPPQIYWANLGTNSIEQANIDGTPSNLSPIGGANEPTGVAVNGRHIYWTSLNSNSIGEANLDGTGVTQTLITGANLPWGIAVSVPVAQLSPASPAVFPTTPQGTLSAPETVTVTNGGQRDLMLTGLSFGGADPGDFVVTSDGCQGPVAPDESCRLTIAFAPEAQGTRTANLLIASNDLANDPLQVALTGTGGSLPAGPRGPAGPQGPVGPPGKVIVIIRLTRDCVVHVLAGTVHWPTSDTAHRVTISRRHRVYATGRRIAMSHGRSEFVLNESRPLPHGRYTLTLRVRRGGYWTTKRVAITV